MESAIREALSQHYAKSASAIGWRFVALIDCEYIDSDLEKIGGTSLRVPIAAQPVVGTDIPGESRDLIARVKGCADIQQQFALLESLTDLNVAALTVDSFPGLAGEALNRAINHQLEAQHLNVVIIGAGPVGLTLASALKRSLGNRINVLVVENRVHDQHHKKRYTRNWITHLPLDSLQGMVAEEVMQVFAHLSGGRYVGVNINIMESLLLLSCRMLGVNFLFSQNHDMSFLGGSNANVVFDASGNGWRPCHWPENDADIVPIANVPTDLPDLHINIAPFGVERLYKPENKQIGIGAYGDVFMPLYRGRRMKVAQLKVVNLPIRLYSVLLRYILANNADNKFYLWHGDLLPQINRAILVVNLKKSEYQCLATNLAGPTKIAEVAHDRALMENLDERVVQVLEMIACDAEAANMVTVEPPFLLEPYLFDVQKGAEKLHGKPIIRIGDSLYNGNVKLGNGLGLHLGYARNLAKIFTRNFSR